MLVGRSDADPLTAVSVVWSLTISGDSVIVVSCVFWVEMALKSDVDGEPFERADNSVTVPVVDDEDNATFDDIFDIGDTVEFGASVADVDGDKDEVETGETFTVVLRVAEVFEVLVDILGEPLEAIIVV